MPLTPEERRTYEELKARQDAETHSIRRLIRYWVVAILTVVVLGSVVDLASNGEARTRYNKLDEDFLTGLAHVNPVYLANVYYHYVVESPDPDYNFLMNPFQRVMRMFWRAVLTGFIFTLWTVAKEGWPNAVLVGIAILLPFVPFFMVDDFFVPGGAIKKWLFFVAAVTVFLSILYPFAWFIGLFLKGLLQFLGIFASIPFIGGLLLKVTEHHFSVKVIRRLARETD